MPKYQTPDGKLFIVEPDLYPFNPRKEYDHLGTFYALQHRNHMIGEKQFETKEEMHDEIDDKNVFVSLPVYVYEHGNIKFQTGPFSDPWDSGQIGVIFVTHARARAEFGENYKEKEETIERCLIGEIEEYSSYVSGDTWQCWLVEPSTCETCQHTDGEIIDSCCGFYGYDLDNMASGVGYGAEDLQEMKP